MGSRTVGGSQVAVASRLEQPDTVRERHDRPGPVGTGLEGVLDALRALRPAGPAGAGAPVCCTWVCRIVAGEAHDRGRAAPAAEPGQEFETVLVRRLVHRYLRVVTDAAAGRPVARAWELLLDPPPAPPARLALAGVRTLLVYDLTLAFASTCTVLGRTPGPRERAAHARVAARLGACAGELAGRTGGPADVAAAAALDGPARREAARRRAESLWSLRGRPSEAEAERDALDREVHAAALRQLAGDG
jgi:hypothetical protein